MRILPDSSDLLRYAFKYINRFNGAMNTMAIFAGICAIALAIFFAILSSANPLIAFVMLPCAAVLLISGVLSLVTGVCGVINSYLNEALAKSYDKREAALKTPPQSYLSMLPSFMGGGTAPTPEAGREVKQEKPKPQKEAPPTVVTPVDPIKSVESDEPPSSASGWTGYLPGLPSMPGWAKIPGWS